ncbi:SpoIIE family protein phosphatase [Streptomyces sp. MC1]|uniref:PP2C family protein-serine/threonine phosphatase n=1 Tax=Streptomyces sp. MC1 TaxID=295105 RepID=UPI0018C98112|nr:PP2C family protein-serine/threonine phosphatase [Streptomyces sp. MC1]MBG7696827.1 SpoIIE family protein phosphatase [Streptomyces sp. MC1]
MPSPVSADHPAAQPPGRGSVEALITQARRLKGDVDAVRRDTRSDGADPEERWQRALCDLALHQLDDLDAHLAQLRDGPQPAPAEPAAPPAARPAPAAAPSGSLLSRVGSAEWNLLTDEATWSGELYQILGLDPARPALTLDELPSLVVDEDRPTLTAMVTDCLVDAKPIDGEFRVVRPDASVRTVHMMGEPVLGADGGTTSMWAVLRDVSELRRSQRTVRETRDSLHRHRRQEQTEHRIAAELQEAVLPPWRGSLRLPRHGPGALDLAAHRLPAATATPLGGDWYDALELTDGQTLLSVGDLTGQGVAVASGMATLLGAVRGMAMAGTEPGQLLTLLNQLLDTTVQPALGSAVCCRYRPETRTLVWAQAGHPAPLLYRDGTGRVLDTPDGVLLGASSGAVYGQSVVTLLPGDLLLLHTDGLMSGHGRTAAVDRLLGLAPRFGAARTAQDCVRTVVEEFGGSGREDDACVLVAKVTT